MTFSLKKQLSGYQSWLDLANTIELTEIKALNRYDFITFSFVFIAMSLLSVMISQHNPSLSLFALVMHLYLGINILKARRVVTDAQHALNNYENLNSNIIKFLNNQYSLFLVAQGKKPLSQNAIDNLEIHTGKFIEGKMSRGGRADSIRRFRLHYLKGERTFFTILFVALIMIEFFVIF